MPCRACRKPSLKRAWVPLLRRRVPAAPGASFGEVLSQMTDSVGQKLQAAEATSIQGIKGDVPVRDVVSSVMEAEQSLQTAIAIRDKIVQAYLEISRMPI